MIKYEDIKTIAILTTLLKIKIVARSLSGWLSSLEILIKTFGLKFWIFSKSFEFKEKNETSEAEAIPESKRSIRLSKIYKIVSNWKNANKTKITVLNI